MYIFISGTWIPGFLSSIPCVWCKFWHGLKFYPCLNWSCTCTINKIMKKILGIKWKVWWKNNKFWHGFWPFFSFLVYFCWNLAKMMGKYGRFKTLKGLSFWQFSQSLGWVKKKWFQVQYSSDSNELPLLGVHIYTHSDLMKFTYAGS